MPLIKYLMHDPAWSSGLFRKLNMNFGMAPSLAIIIFCGARYQTAFSRALSVSALIALGDASYSIYLIHSVVLLIADHFGGGMPAADLSHIAWAFGKFVTLIAIVLVISLFSYAYIEFAIAPMAALALGKDCDRPQPRVRNSCGGLPTAARLRYCGGTTYHHQWC